MSPEWPGDLIGDSPHNAETDSLRESKRERIALLCVFAATLLCLLIGIRAHWPYFVEEHRRLSPWQWIPFWLGDVSALFWFISAMVSPQTLVRSTNGGRDVSKARQRRRRKFLISMGAAIAIDFSHTAYLHWHEAADFSRAEVVAGEVVANQVWEGRDCTRYYVQVRFRDRMNRVHKEEVRVQRGNIGGLPANAQKALTSGRVPFSVRVSFDSDLPARCWLTDMGYYDGDRIYLFSYVVLIFQIYGTLAFFGLISLQHRSGYDPWWESLYRPLPLVITAFVLVVFAAPLMANLRH
jgi:hypothetical protein